MKKIASIFLLAAAVCSVVSVTANAQDTEVTFNVAPSYTVTIPEEVVLELQDDGTYAKDAAVSATNVRLKHGAKVTVALSGDFQLDNEGAVPGVPVPPLPYTVKVGNSTAAITSGDVVAQFHTDSDLTSVQKSEPLHFAAERPTFAGDYKDTVTFTISVA